VLEFRVLGELEVLRDGAPLALPPSRKTRALLAYLALTRRAHRRERLCEIFWDVPDDPRGALRWSLSKIRPVIDDPAHPRLIADRNSVELRTESLGIDLLAAQACVRVSAGAAATCDLAQAASSFRAPLLADLDLPANSEFHSWLLSLREDARKLQAQILRALTERFGATPDAALSYARELVRIDPYDETAWALLITNLAAAGRSGEVGEQYEAGLRVLRDVGGGSGALLRAWRTVHGSATRLADCDTISAASPVGDLPARNLPAVAISEPAAPRLSIVVLPFVNLSNDPEQQYFADGITGDLITDLSRIPDMLVISRYTAFTYRDKPVDIKQIGRELGVRYALEGEVQRSGTRVRVTAQLIDAERDMHLWAERFDGDPGDLFAWQDEITNRIAVALDLELVDAAAARPSERPDARDYILRGRAVRLKPPSRENRTNAVALFEQALALDQEGSVAKASAPRDEGSDRGGPGRVGFQGAPLWRRDRALGGALVLPLRYKLSRSRADDGRTRRVGRSLDHLPMGPEVRARNREAAALALAPSALRELAGRRDLREGPRQMGLSLPSRRQAGQHDRFLSLPDAEHDGGQAFPGQGAQGAEGLGTA